MTPFENLIQELGPLMGAPLHPDSHQSCLISFPEDDLSIQIDLDTNADKILVGTQLGRITPGSYREKIFLQAMRFNGTTYASRGILAFSEKNDSLIYFQYLPLLPLTGDRLFQFLQTFRITAKLWKRAVARGEIPTLEEKREMR